MSRNCFCTKPGKGRSENRPCRLEQKLQRELELPRRVVGLVNRHKPEPAQRAKATL